MARLVYIGVLVLSIFITAISIRQVITLKAELYAATREINLQENIVKNSSDATLAQEEKRNEIEQSRKEISKKIDAIICDSDPLYIDALVRLLSEDAENRCRSSSGNSSH